MLDLLLTPGRWDASLRLGYALLTPRQDLVALTSIFDQAFTRWAVGLDVAHRDDCARPLVVGCTSLAEVFARNTEATRRLVDALDAVRFIQALHASGKADPVFVMTGEVDTLMGAAVGQGVKTDAPRVERVFATGAGWRTAEPATVSAAATHATLTQLLLRLGHDMRTRCCGAPSGGRSSTSAARSAK